MEVGRCDSSCVAVVGPGQGEVDSMQVPGQSQSNMVVDGVGQGEGNMVVNEVDQSDSMDVVGVEVAQSEGDIDLDVVGLGEVAWLHHQLGERNSQTAPSAHLAGGSKGLTA